MKLPKQLFEPSKPTWTYFHPTDTQRERLRKVLNVGRMWRLRRGYNLIREATGLDNEEIKLCWETLERWEQRDVEEAL